MLGVRNKHQLCRFLLLVAIFDSIGLFLYFIIIKSTLNQSRSAVYVNLDDLKYIIKFTNEDKCVAVSKESLELVVAFCNMNSVKPFVYQNGILRSVESGLCVSARISNLRVLELSNCEDAINFTIANKTLVEDRSSRRRGIPQNEPHFCVATSRGGKIKRYPELGESLVLTHCHKTVISVELMTETKFLAEIATPAPILTPPPDKRPCDSPGCEITGKFRIQFSYAGKCVGISKENSLTVSFCNPRERQSFFYSRGIFISVERALCIGVNKSNLRGLELMLTSCDNAVRLLFIDGELCRDAPQLKLCVSPLTETQPSQFPEVGAKVVLAPCQKPSSSVDLLEEAEFLKDRAALLLPFPQNDSCNFPGCGINKRPEFPILLPEEKVTKCENLSDCVTIIVKTARRPYFVIRLARSVKQYLDENVPIIVIDDGPDSHPPDIMEEISRFPNIKYVISKTADVGIAEGRTRAVQMVKTKYFLSFDDDMMVPEHSGIPKMVELLDTTDLSLVGARGKTSWAGLVDFYTDEEGQQVLRQLHGTCTAKRLELPFIKGCHQCDLTVMVVLARTNDILEVGGWSKELKISEHVDIFLRLKAAGKKVAICSSFQFQHDPSKNETVFNEVAYRKLRWNRMKQMSNRFLNHWNIHKFKKVST